MRTKKVNRYWCDYCNKAGLQAGAMRKHEKHCTLNADRECRMCQLLETGSEPLVDLMAILPDPTAYLSSTVDNDQFDEHKRLVEQCAAVFKQFQDAADGCPACMMAALRLKKIPVPMMESFDFQAEVKQIFAHANYSESRGY